MNGKMRVRGMLAGLSLLPLVWAAGCAAGPGGQAAGPSFGQVVGQAMGEVLATSLAQGADRAMGKFKGKIRSIRVVGEDPSGYILEVSYSGVRVPQGAALVAEAYGPAGLLTEYTCAPVPVAGTGGRARLRLAYQASGWSYRRTAPERIVVKLFRDNQPDNYFASSSYDLASRQATETGPAPSSAQPPAAPPAQVEPVAVTPTPQPPPQIQPTAPPAAQGTVVMKQPATRVGSNLSMVPVSRLALAANLPVKAFSLGSSRGCGTQDAKTSFLTSDPAVFLRVQLADVRAGDRIAYEWTGPGGVRYPTRHRIAAPHASFCDAGSMPIAGGAAATHPGTWTVRFLYNDQVKVTQTFTISQPALKMQMPIIPRIGR